MYCLCLKLSFHRIPGGFGVNFHLIDEQHVLMKSDLSAPSSFLAGNTHIFNNSCLAFAQESGRPSCTPPGIPFFFLRAANMMIDTSLD